MNQYHLFIGNFGHFCVILAFVAAMVAAWSYFQATRLRQTPKGTAWNKFARWAFIVHGVAVLGVVGALYWIIYNHYFEYHYAYDNSSLSLPLEYTVSSFWQDQEGSFLLWIFWHVILGFVFLVVQTRKQKQTKPDTIAWEAPVMAIFAGVQAFLCSMILGVIFFDVFKIGSSPFLLLKEALPDLPVWKMQPNFIPKDGNGLNPLLQNYWMVIHPPTLFLGFAATILPFAFCIAGLWLGRFKAWVRPALPWTLFAALTLGAGIIMGGIWAYETLNFEGYWNWDPVENAVYVPWLVLVASVHTMIIHNNNQTALRTSIILVISMFILVLYSTFLTRSGILGNASVHSFTDLGLSGQLLLYLFFFTAVAIGLLVYHWKQIPVDTKELSTYSREFWIFVGATILCLAGFQVIVTTSIPVYNAILENIGIKSKLALPADQVQHYTKFQQWFFVGVAIISGIGQYIWWNRIKKASPSAATETAKVVSKGLGAKLHLGAWEALSTPLMFTFISSAIIISTGRLNNPIYITILTASLFSVFSNGSIMLSVLRKKIGLSGGAVAHIGVALMLIGILFSAGYSKVVSQNSSGLILFKDASTEENTENQLLWLNRPQKLDKFLITYKGKRLEARDMPHYLPEETIQLLDGDFKAIAKQDLTQDGKTYHKKGDTLEVFPENYYYEIEYREPSGRVFSLFPRVQINPRMGNAASPAIRHEWQRDVYTHVKDAPLPTSEPEWSKTETHTVAMQDTFFVNDYVAILDGVVRTDDVDGVKLNEGDAAVKAVIRVMDKDRTVELNPTYVIKDGMVGRKPLVDKELGLRIRFENIDPKTGQFSFATNSTQRDYVVIKAIEKPFINLLWIGTVVMLIGMSIAMWRRFGEANPI
ncbi:MAG: cytochrome c biogenesis protein CcsA [Spirosomataceae bacterium]